MRRDIHTQTRTQWISPQLFKYVLRDAVCDEDVAAWVCKHGYPV